MDIRRARVLAPYATVKILDPVSGKPTVAGFYAGAVLPPEADPEDVARLVRREYAEWLDSGEEKVLDKQEDEAEKAQADAAKRRADDAEAAIKKADAEHAEAEKAAEAAAKAEAEAKPVKSTAKPAAK
jgi:hypothetical protein